MNLSSDQKTWARKYLAGPLKLNNGDIITNGQYLFEVLPNVLEQTKRHYREATKNFIDILAFNIERDKNYQGSNPAANITWENGGIERFLGGTNESVYKELIATGRKYFVEPLESDSEAKVNFTTSLRQSFQAALYAERYQEIIAEALSIVGSELHSKLQAQSNLSSFDDELKSATFLQVILVKRDEEEEITKHYKIIEFINTEIGQKYQDALKRLYLRDAEIPKNSEAFEQGLKSFIQMLQKAVSTQTERI